MLRDGGSVRKVQILLKVERIWNSLTSRTGNLEFAFCLTVAANELFAYVKFYTKVNSKHA